MTTRVESGAQPRRRTPPRSGLYWVVRAVALVVLAVGGVVALADPAEAQDLFDSGLGEQFTFVDVDLSSVVDDSPAGCPIVEVPEVPEVPDVPDVGISINSEAGGLSQSVTIILLLTIGAVAPSILLLMTSFTRFAIVLSLTRNAIGTQQIPPTQVLTGLALFLTFFVMAPVLSQINDDALQPFLNGEIEQAEAFEAGFAPLREFMAAQVGDDDLRLFLELRGEEVPTTVEEVPASVMIPAFVLSELRIAFTIGFVIFVPFLVIDLVVASVLMSMGMVMLPPVFISLPLKLLMFVLVDGWGLIVHSLVASVNTG